VIWGGFGRSSRKEKVGNKVANDKGEGGAGKRKAPLRLWLDQGPKFLRSDQNRVHQRDNLEGGGKKWRSQQRWGVKGLERKQRERRKRGSRGAVYRNLLCDVTGFRDRYFLRGN